MGLRSPFGYVGYEIQMSKLFIAVLDNLCAHCHTNQDYQDDCHGCPAGSFAFKCKDYITTAEGEDRHHELYLSEEWAKRKEQMGHPRPTEEELAQDHYFVSEYKLESEVLRAMKQKIKRIIPHPFFYIRHHQKYPYPYERPKALADFVELLKRYEELHDVRLCKWGVIKRNGVIKGGVEWMK